jgi:hypothetical protein
MNPNNNKVLEVEGGKDVEGQPVLAWNKHGKANQRWRIIYLDKAEKMQEKGLHEDFGFHINRPFYIRSRLPMQRLAEMHGNTYIYMRRWVLNRKGQVWRFNGQDKTIRNENWKNYAAFIQSNGGGQYFMTTATINSRWWMMWRYDGTFITNEKGKVVDV